MFKSTTKNFKMRCFATTDTVLFSVFSVFFVVNNPPPGHSAFLLPSVYESGDESG
jgi:hypothetical protein